MHQKHYSEQLGTNFTKAKNYENNFPFGLSTFVLGTLPKLREQAGLHHTLQNCEPLCPNETQWGPSIKFKFSCSHIFKK